MPDLSDDPATVVIGGGQAGLATSYHLRRLGVPHVVYDAAQRAGEAWRRRWDSLQLFTPPRIDRLDGTPFPRGGEVPTKDEFADYLESYERAHDLPVRHGTRVTALAADDDGGFRLRTEVGGRVADRVVVAMSSLQDPHVPAMAGDLAPHVRSLHSAEYRNPDLLPAGDVLVVGAGNSGAQIAVDVARSGRVTWLAGSEAGHLPFRLDGWFGRHVGSRVLGVLFLHVLNTGNPVGRQARPAMQLRTDPLLSDRPPELRRAGVRRVPRVVAVRDGLPVAQDGTVLDVAAVVWCTGFRPGLEDWVHLPVLDERGLPRQVRGVAEDLPGLFFVGQNFLYSKASEQIPGVSRDARHVAEQVAAA